MTIKNIMKHLVSSYNKTSTWCRILMFMSLFLLVVIAFKRIDLKREGFQQQDSFLTKTGEDIYDDFYAKIYDHLVFNTLKNDYEISYILNNATPTPQSKILDVGCGTGHHVASLVSKNFDVCGVDISPAMIKEAKENYPKCDFKIGDALQNSLVEPESITHILCMYFTIYYFKDKTQFFNNCISWLAPGGVLILHIVDREQFDPILPPGNPLLYVSPQRYAKKRITSTKVKFTDFSYSADFKLDESDDKALFVEKFKNDNDGKVRKNEHVMYMEDSQRIIDEAQSCGFIIQGKADLLQCQYEYQYIYILSKPS